MIDDAHWSIQPDRETTLAGRFYVGPGGGVYRLRSHHRCGFHVEHVDGPRVFDDRRHCISERAIDRTYHEMWEETRAFVENRASEGNPRASAAIRAAAGSPNARFFRRDRTWLVDTNPPVWIGPPSQE